VAAFHEWPGVTEFIHVKLHTSAIAKTVSLIVALNGFNDNATVDASHALQCFLKHIGLEFALASESDMTKLCATGTANTGLLPNVFNAVGRRHQNFLWLGTAKSAAAIFIDQSANFLAGQYVRYKDHSPIVACDEDSAVGNFFDF
jgi:hypothetical protein